MKMFIISSLQLLRLKNYFSFWIIIVLFLNSSCEEKLAVDYEANPSDLIIVEGMVTNELKRHFVKLSYPVNDLNTRALPVSKAEVSVFVNQIQINYTEDANVKGMYYSDSMFIAVIDKFYSLIIKIDNKHYSAGAHAIPVIQPDSVRLILDSSQNSYTINSSIPIASVTESAMYEIDLDWSHVSGYENVTPNMAKLFFYTFNTLDVCQIFAPQSEEIIFPAGTKIKQRKYSLSSDYATYLRGVLMECRWNGGFFDEDNSNPKTNLSAGATGFFAVCMVVERNYIAN